MNYYGYNDYRDYLAHHGVVGMKWGVRRYQPYSVTGARTSGKRGKEIGLAARISGAWRTHRANKKRRANLEKARKLQAERDRLVRSGTAEEVMKNRDKLRPEDMYRYTERVQAEAVLAQTLQQQREQRTKELFAKADEVEKMARKVANYVDAANGLYKNVKQLKGNIDDLRGVPSKAERQKQEQAAANAEREKLIRSVTLEEALANQQNYSDDELGRILGREGKKDDIAGKIKQNQEEAAAKATSGTAKSETASTNSSEPKRAESSSSSGEASKSDSTSSSTSESSGSSTTKAPHQWLDAGTAAREVAERAGLKGSAADDFVRSSVQKTLNLPEYKSSFDKFKMSTPRSEADKKTAQEWMAKRGISFDKPADKAPDASWLKGRITNPSEARRSPADRPKNAVDIRDAAKERKFFTSKEKTGPSKIGDKGFGTTRTDQFGGWESRNKKIGGSKTPDRRTINISGEPAAPKATPSPAHYSFNSGASSAYSKSYLSEIAKRAGSAASSSSSARSSMSSILRSSGSTKVSDFITRYSAPETPTYDRTQSNNWKRMHGKVESRSMRHDAFMVIQNGIYYGNNDYRDYLAHHGVIGMKWGVRRYQPYSVTGGRTSGKRGKEIGLAAKLAKGAAGSGMSGRIRKTGAKKQSEKVDLVPLHADTKLNRALGLTTASNVEQRYGPKKQSEKVDLVPLHADTKLNRALGLTTASNVEKKYGNAKAGAKKESGFSKTIANLRDKNTKAYAGVLDKELQRSKSKDEKVNNRFYKMAASYSIGESLADSPKYREKMKRKLSVVNESVSYIQAGQKKYNDIISARRDTLLKTLDNPEYRKSAEYKKAKRDYTVQAFKNGLHYNDTDRTKAKYALEYETAARKAKKEEEKKLKHSAIRLNQNGIYYGNNDYRDYLAHHGVVGMHWGVRRYQPYGMGGYNRVGGKTGKMVGLASDYAKEQKREAKLASFKAKQGGIIDSDVEKTNRVYDRAERRIRAKYEKAIEKGSGYEKLKKIGDKYGANEYKRELKLAKLAIEKSKVMNYSYEDMRNENRAVLAATARSVGLTATSAALTTLGVTPIAVIFMPNTRKARTDARLTSEDKANAKIGAKEISEDTRQKLRGAYGKEYPDTKTLSKEDIRKMNADFDGDDYNFLAAPKADNKYSYGEAKPHPGREEYQNRKTLSKEDIRKMNAYFDGDDYNSLAARSSRAATSNAESGKSKHYDSEGNFSSNKSAAQFDKDTKFAKERVMRDTSERQAYERAIDWKYGPKNGEAFKKDIASTIKVRDAQRSKAAEAAIDDFISKRGLELANAKVGSRREADPISQLSKQVKKERKARAAQKKKAETAERREERKQAAKDKVDNVKQTVTSKVPKKKTRAQTTKAAPAPYNGDVKQLQNDLSTKNKYAYNPFQKNVRVDRNNARIEYKPILARKRPDYNGAYAANNTPVSERATQVWNPSTKRYENLPKKKRA